MSMWGNYTELGMKCKGLEANYHSAGLYTSGADQGLRWSGSGTVRLMKLAASPTQGQSWVCNSHPRATVHSTDGDGDSFIGFRYGTGPDILYSFITATTGAVVMANKLKFYHKKDKACVILKKYFGSFKIVLDVRQK